MRVNSILDLKAVLSPAALARNARIFGEYEVSIASLPIDAPQADSAPKRAAPRNALDGPKREFEQQCALCGIALEREFRFHPTRKWRADYKVTGTNILIEYEGGVRESDRQQSGHLSYTGYKKDIEKYNEMTVLGYLLIRIYAATVKSGEALAWLKRALNHQHMDDGKTL